MIGMATTKKAKVSITIAADLLAEIDAFAERSGIGSRSNVIERWLRGSAREQRGRQLAQDTVEYYASLTAAEVREDADWAAAASDEFDRLGID